MTQDPAPHQAPEPGRDQPHASPHGARGHGVPGHPTPASRRADDCRDPARDDADGLDRLNAALHAAVDRYYAGDRTPDPRVRAAVHAVTDAMRADGVDVVTALRTVKAQVAERGIPPGRLFDDVVRWCIARYYEGAPSPAPLPSASGRGAPDPGHQARPT
jgi:hypothetical protein